MSDDPVNPADAGPNWRASTYSDGEQAVRLAKDGDMIVVRDPQNPKVLLRFTRGEMRAFLQGAKAGEFDDLV